MSKYIITHGSIASVQYVTLPDGNKVIVTDARDGSEIELPKLPLKVQASVNRQFGLIFALPYDSRQAFIDNSIPFEVEVTE
jgi:chromosome condensin MukBEF MukE localization factor